ncbi:hypothetical protein JNB88_05890 [Rhizobium cauense]|uniref:hypothetical protein n=1 Tax=Rhizobium cauense TaxID=1166683 RepID=UPI001C6EB4FF|nr:hypothetical protein [Rhizobium cauense]MBW9113179.1 hypothetical protein [Rhizobium cauense]
MKAELLTAALLCLSTGLAGADELVDLGNDFTMCLRLEALDYGLKSCLPPSELIPAVYHSCKNYQDKVQEYVAKERSAAVVQTTMDQVRGALLPELTGIIVDAHIKRGCP